MNDIETLLKNLISEAFKKMGHELDLNDIVIERSKEKAHGDYATNVAMKMARLMRMSPRDIALKLIENINDDNIEKIEIAGPGFVNFFINILICICIW